MSEDIQLQSVCVPDRLQLPSECLHPIIIDFVNGVYLIFGENDRHRLKVEFRMISEPVAVCSMKEDSSPVPPYILLPEQVNTLMQYGYSNVRKLRSDAPFDEAVFQSCSTTPPNFESDIHKATQIAIGRKAKELKRKASGEGANAKQLKIRKKDLEGITVTDEEVNTVLEEISLSKRDQFDDSLINLPMKPEKNACFEFIDHFSLILPKTREFRIQEIVFHDLWKRGFYITTGVRFGCHYLAYEGVPGEVHARFLVECVDSSASLSPLRMISLSRVATQVKKTVLLACVADDSQIPHYMTLDWFKPYDS